MEDRAAFDTVLTPRVVRIMEPPRRSLPDDAREVALYHEDISPQLAVLGELAPA